MSSGSILLRQLQLQQQQRRQRKQQQQQQERRVVRSCRQQHAGTGGGDVDVLVNADTGDAIAAANVTAATGTGSESGNDGRRRGSGDHGEEGEGERQRLANTDDDGDHDHDAFHAAPGHAATTRSSCSTSNGSEKSGDAAATVCRSTITNGATGTGTTDVQTETQVRVHVEVEVCLGPDCSGGGGGAALLEIEDLVGAVGRNCTICSGNAGIATGATPAADLPVTVSIGGCRDHCTVGPNVYLSVGRGTYAAAPTVASGGSSNRTATTNCGAAISISADARHHTRVNNPDACRNVVGCIEAAIATAIAGTSSTSSAGITKSEHADNFTAACTTTTTTSNDRNNEDDADDAEEDGEQKAATARKLLARRDDGRRWRELRKRAAKERRLRVREWREREGDGSLVGNADENENERQQCRWGEMRGGSCP